MMQHLLENVCENIAVLNNGVIVEYGTMKNVIDDPKNDYTKKLLKSNFNFRKFRK